jgi:hypothetical protein
MAIRKVAEDMKRTKKTARETPDPHQVFNHGLRFLTTDQAVRRIFGGDPNWSPVIAPPTMVLSAFASELLLKCLLVIETGEAPDNIHELHTLFGKLKHKTKRRIEEVWDAECRGKIEGLAKLQGVPTDLPNALFRCTKAFERLRYAYEDQFRDVTFYIGDFPGILARVISEIKPEWAPSEPPPIPGFKSPG